MEGKSKIITKTISSAKAGYYPPDQNPARRNEKLLCEKDKS